MLQSLMLHSQCCDYIVELTSKLGRRFFSRWCGAFSPPPPFCFALSPSRGVGVDGVDGGGGLS